MTQPTQAQIEVEEYNWCPKCQIWSPLFLRAKEVGKLCNDCNDKVFASVMAAAAEVGPKTEDAFTHAMDIAEAKASTIERCAQVAERLKIETWPQTEIATAIRALKDK